MFRDVPPPAKNPVLTATPARAPRTGTSAEEQTERPWAIAGEHGTADRGRLGLDMVVGMSTVPAETDGPALPTVPSSGATPALVSGAARRLVRRC